MNVDIVQQILNDIEKDLSTLQMNLDEHNKAKSIIRYYRQVINEIKKEEVNPSNMKEHGD